MTMQSQIVGWGHGPDGAETATGFDQGRARAQGCAIREVAR